jgi:hypothetical protein
MMNSKVLFVDDDVNLLTLLKRNLSYQGSGKTRTQALDHLSTRNGFYDMQLLHSLRTALGATGEKSMDLLETVSAVTQNQPLRVE